MLHSGSLTQTKVLQSFYIERRLAPLDNIIFLVLFCPDTLHTTLIACCLSSHSGTTITGAHAVARHLCRLAQGAESATPLLYGITNLEKAEIDHWLEFSLTSLSQQQGADVSTSLSRLEAVLAARTYLVGYDLSLADLAVYSSLRGKGACHGCDSLYNIIAA